MYDHFLPSADSGVHDEEVKCRDKPQSFTAAKSFAPIAHVNQQLEAHVWLMCQELDERLRNDFENVCLCLFVSQLFLFILYRFLTAVSMCMWVYV